MGPELREVEARGRVRIVGHRGGGEGEREGTEYRDKAGSGVPQGTGPGDGRMKRGLRAKRSELSPSLGVPQGELNCDPDGEQR